MNGDEPWLISESVYAGGRHEVKGVGGYRFGQASFSQRSLSLENSSFSGPRQQLLQ